MSRHVRSGLIVFGGVLAGRLVGFVRDLLISVMFGRTGQADVAVLVVTVPDALLNILIGGAMGAALIPEFKRRSPEEGWRLFGQASRGVLLVAATATLLLSLGSGAVIKLIAPGVAVDSIDLARPLVSICLWAVPFTAVAAVCRAFLQSHERFVAPALSGFIYNLSLVAAMTVAAAAKLPALAWCAVIGAALSLTVQLSDTWRRRRPSDGTGWLISKSLVTRFGQALGAGIMLLTMPVVLKAFASRFGEGGLAQAHLATKLVDLPLGVALTSVSVALFPTIAQKLVSTETRADGVKLAQQGMRVVFSLGLPISLGMGVFALDWARLLYGHGKMTPAETMPIGAFAAVLMVGLLPQALNTLVLSVFDSLRDMVSPFVVTTTGLGLTIASCAIGAGQGNLPWLAWSYAFAHWSMFAALLLIARKKHGIDLFRPVFGAAAALQTFVTVGLFMAATVGLGFLHLPAGVRVLASILIGLGAGAVGLATDSSTRVILTGIIRSKLGGN